MRDIKTTKEHMDELDESYNELANSMDKTVRLVMKQARNRFYDVLVYFGYTVMLMHTFGINSEVIIPKEIVDLGNQGKAYRIEQVVNDDESLTLKLVELTENE